MDCVRITNVESLQRLRPNLGVTRAPLSLFVGANYLNTALLILASCPSLTAFILKALAQLKLSGNTSAQEKVLRSVGWSLLLLLCPLVAQGTRLDLAGGLLLALHNFLPATYGKPDEALKTDLHSPSALVVTLLDVAGTFLGKPSPLVFTTSDTRVVLDDAAEGGLRIDEADAEPGKSGDPPSLSFSRLSLAGCAASVNKGLVSLVDVLPAAFVRNAAGEEGNAMVCARMCALPPTYAIQICRSAELPLNVDCPLQLDITKHVTRACMVTLKRGQVLYRLCAVSLKRSHTDAVDLCSCLVACDDARLVLLDDLGKSGGQAVTLTMAQLKQKGWYVDTAYYELR